jgi:hypothetical protein
MRQIHLQEIVLKIGFKILCGKEVHNSNMLLATQSLVVVIVVYLRIDSTRVACSHPRHKRLKFLLHRCENEPNLLVMIQGCNAELEVRYLCAIVSDPSLNFVGGQVLINPGPKATSVAETCQGLQRVAKITRQRAAKVNFRVDTVIGRRRGGLDFRQETSNDHTQVTNLGCLAQPGDAGTRT